MNMLKPVGHAPSILEVITDLSNDEVFTPPKVANAVLDLLPDHVWTDPSLRWLDVGAKTGVFLREIARRLMVGLTDEIADDQQRLDHILHNMVYGIAITELTSLMSRRTVYCSKHANSEHSVVAMPTDEGNVWFARVEHSYKNGRCTECSASEALMERDNRENHAYAFIHAAGRKAFEKEHGMNFDVIVGNPPYQLQSDGGTRDMPIYNIFVDQARSLNPRYIAMIIPSRWMAGGLGLAEFRRSMLGDKHIRELVDYPNAAEVFPSVGINGGVCYFLWDHEHDGACNIATVRAGERIGPELRSLDEFDVLVRDARALDILRRVLALGEPSINTILARDKEFGWTSNFDGFHSSKKPGDVPIHYIRSVKRAIGFIPRSHVTKSAHLIDTWKLLVPAVGSGRERERTGVDLVLGPPLIASAPSVCTQSFLFFHVANEEEAQSLKSYYATRFFRFLVSLRKISQHATHSTYRWVPIQTWDQPWTDAELYKKYGITADEQAFIAELIREMPA